MLLNINKAKSGKLLLSILTIFSLCFVVGCYSSAPSRGWSGPVVSDDGILYVGTIEGKVIALDTSTGEPIGWEKELEKKATGGFGCAGRFSQPMSIYGTPWVGDEVVYVGGYDGNVYAFDIESSMSSKFETGGAIVGSPIVAYETLFVGSSDGKLYALNLDLSPKWGEPFKTGDKIWSTPAINNGVVYIGSCDHRLYALDAETGEEIWRFEAEAAILSTPLVSEGTVYVGDCHNKFYAIDAATEEERLTASERGEGDSAPDRTAKWVFNKAGNWFWTQALAYNGEIWVGCLDHKVYAINAQDPEDFKEVLETEGMIRTPPVLVNGLIIIGSEDGNIYAINPDDKTSTPLRDLEAPILAPIYANIENGVIYVHAQDGEHMLYAIDVETGDDIWMPYKTSG